MKKMNVACAILVLLTYGYHVTADPTVASSGAVAQPGLPDQIVANIQDPTKAPAVGTQFTLTGFPYVSDLQLVLPELAFGKGLGMCNFVFPGAGASGVPSGNFTARYQDKNGHFIEATKQLIDTALAFKGQAGYVPTMATGVCSDSGMAGWYARDVTTNEEISLPTGILFADIARFNYGQSVDVSLTYRSPLDATGNYVWHPWNTMFKVKIQSLPILPTFNPVPLPTFPNPFKFGRRMLSA